MIADEEHKAAVAADAIEARVQGCERGGLAVPVIAVCVGRCTVDGNDTQVVHDTGAATASHEGAADLWHGVLRTLH